MLTFWSDCKLGVKLQAAFGLVMLLFVAAIIGIFVLNAKVEAIATFQATTIVPARAAANRIATFAATADGDGAYYIADDLPAAEAAQRLVKYRADIASYQAKVAEATKLADNDTQRALVADIHTAADGPKGWLQGNEHAIALKAAGKSAAARHAYFASPPVAVLAVVRGLLGST